MSYDLINAIRFLSPEEQGKKGCKLKTGCVRIRVQEEGMLTEQQQVYSESNAFRLYVQSYHALELFFFFLSFIYKFQNSINFLLLESISTSMIHHKQQYLLFLANPVFKTFLIHPHRVPSPYLCLVQSNLFFFWEAATILLQTLSILESQKYNIR